MQNFGKYLTNRYSDSGQSEKHSIAFDHKICYTAFETYCQCVQQNFKSLQYRKIYFGIVIYKVYSVTVLTVHFYSL